MFSEQLEMKNGFSMIKEESRFGFDDQEMSENVSKVSGNQTKRRLGNVKDDYDGLSPNDPLYTLDCTFPGGNNVEKCDAINFFKSE